MFATHYHELAAMADELPHLNVYTMMISDDEQGGIVFLHRVAPGSIGRSYGVHVAKLAGMPPSIVQRAEAVLQQLEDGKHGQEQHSFLEPIEQAIAIELRRHNGNSMVAERSGRYEWQSDEARYVATLMEQGEMEPDLDDIDVCAITPLDALNLMFLLQKKRNKRKQ